MFTEYAPEDAAADIGLIDLELTVKVYNIKDGRNAHIVQRCEELRGYSIFTDMIRGNRKTVPLKEAIIKAIDDCIAQNILKDILIKLKKEVVGMLLVDWDFDTAMEVCKEESFEDGRIEGIEKGRAEGRTEGVLKTARAMKERGLDISIIAEVTELPIDTILNL
jgi:predicted transposase/invertase (TIGR01784 family)